ncbi:MAG: hypothetical protein ABI068_12825 [Ktedonobacterales bacterium]
MRQIAVGHENDPEVGWVLVQAPDFKTLDPSNWRRLFVRNGKVLSALPELDDTSAAPRARRKPVHGDAGNRRGSQPSTSRGDTRSR